MSLNDNIFQRIEMYQRKNLEIALKELDDADEMEKKAIEDRMMAIRAMKY